MAARFIGLAEPQLGAEEEKALAEVIRSGWITMGERVAALERAFAELHGRKEALAVSSCTAALHLALQALDIGPGDEVLVPALTFVATANAVRYTGAKPVFVDIASLAQPWMSFEDAAKKLTPHTRAVIVVHYAGYLADMRAWRDFADAHGLFLVEDAAHAPETAGRDGLADASAYSFFGNKNMTTAEGGMLLMRDGARLHRARLLRSHGMTTTTLERRRGHAWSYDVVEVGYNYRMDELRAAVGLVQLARLGARNRRRRELVRRYRARLQALDMRLPFDDEAVGDAHLMPVLLPPGVDRARIMQRMRDQGVQTSIHYPPVHRFRAYRELSPAALPVTESFCARELSLPLHAGMTPEDVDFVVDALGKALAEAG